MKLFKILIFTLLTFLIFKLNFLHPTFSDESFYLNVARNLANGKILYKDFFFAHPPLQVYILAFIFKIFGAAFSLGKIFSLLASLSSAFLLYLIMKKLGDEKAGFVAFIFFIFTPAFLAFSNIEIGMWETMLFLLISIYLLLENKLFLSAFFYLLSFYFRYLSILYLPALLLLIHLRNQKTLKFLTYFVLLLIPSFFLLVFIFGHNYINQTILYHFSKTGISVPLSAQYWQFGYFTFFLSLLSAYVAYTERKKTLLLFSLTPLAVDSFLLMFLKINFYHYFLLSLPFCVLASADVWKNSKSKAIKLFIPLVIAASILFNFSTLDFYLNPVHANKFYTIAEFVSNSTSKNETIFGEPIATNYASFVTGRKIEGDELDSYLTHIKFEGEKTIKKLEENKPKIFIEFMINEEYYYLNEPTFKDFLTNYKTEKIISGTPSYLLLKLI